MIKEGAEGKEVSELQENLNKAGCACDVDGVFGAHTKQALINFQNAFQLDADGIAGPKTIAKLREIAGGTASS